MNYRRIKKDITFIKKFSRQLTRGMRICELVCRLNEHILSTLCDSVNICERMTF